MRTNGPLQLYPLLRIALFLAMGIVVGYECRDVVKELPWLFMMSTAMVVAVVTRRHDISQGIALCIVSFAVGGTLITRHCKWLERTLTLGETAYGAVVASQPQVRGKVLRMDLWIVEGEMAGHRVKASLLRDSTKGDEPGLSIGDGIKAVSKMQRPKDYYASNFSYPLYLRCKGYTATTLIFPDAWSKAVVSLASLSYIDRTVLAAMKFRQATLSRYLSLGLDDEKMSVAVAMALGDRSRLTNDLRDIYSVSGASHVLALSGLHLGIIYVLLSLLLGSRRLGAFRELFIIGGIWSYAVFTGLSSSVVRASVMITIYSFTTLLQRQRMSLNALSLTAIIMLVINPIVLYDVGFQMSFLAVGSILVFYKPIYGLVSSEYLFAHPVIKWLWAMVVVSCCAQLGVAPLTAYYFGRLPVYFLLTNFIVIPLATLILYVTAAMFVSSLVPPLLSYVARLLALLAGWQTAMVRWVSSLPCSSIENIRVNRLQLMMVYVVIAALSVIVYKVFRMKNLLRGR